MHASKYHTISHKYVSTKALNYVSVKNLKTLKNKKNLNLIFFFYQFNLFICFPEIPTL